MKFLLAKITALMLSILLIVMLSACRMPGFSEPFTMETEVPDGPVEYKAGWRAGCRSALSAGKSYVQGWSYPADHGTGAYQQHPDFYAGWSNAWFTCVLHSANFPTRAYTQIGPLK